MQESLLEKCRGIQNHAGLLVGQILGSALIHIDIIYSENNLNGKCRFNVNQFNFKLFDAWKEAQKIQGSVFS